MKRRQEFATRLHSAGIEHHRNRRGFVMMIITIILVLLAFATFAYMGQMQTEYRASSMFGRDIEARMAAESGIEFAAAQIALKESDPSIDVFHNPALFYKRPMGEAETPAGQTRFSVLVPHITGDQGGIPRSGLSTENAKFNINRLIEFENDTDEETDPFTAISFVPGMTEEISNAILDWIDTDDTTDRTGGAESGTYEGLAVPYSARNGPMESIDELLKVQGVTPLLFYGEDANRNGILDPNEDDGEEKPPGDNADGILDLGFRDYLTVSSRERNKLPGGEKKININNGIIAEMHDFIEDDPDLGTEAAKFITGYRMTGDQNADSQAQGKLTIEQQQLVDWIAKNISNGELGQVTRNGMDLSEPPQASFRSIYDLIDAQVQVEISGAPTTLTSPWTTADPALLMEQMVLLEKKITVLNDDFIDGRININIAPKEVLMAMPDMTEELADKIIENRPPIVAGGMSEQMMATRISPIWILTEGLVDLPTFKRLGPWLTTGGDVYTLQVLGHFDLGGPTTRLEAMIDATLQPPRITFQRDLTGLGRGFDPAILDPANQ